jgi:7-cyano-7-deazaguanine synthase
MTEKAVVLLSGGLDSAVCMAVAKDMGYELLPISFDYGQRHSREIDAAKLVAKYYDARHLVMKINLAAIGGSALTDKTMDLPKGNLKNAEIPSTYVPGRNLIFLSYALAFAEVNEASRIFIGVNALDYSGYPDCRPEFINLFQNVADYATKTAAEKKCRIIIETPLLNLSKKDIVLWGNKLKAPLNLTMSCYKGEDAACGVCDSCLLRLKGFSEAAVKDEIKYRKLSTKKNKTVDNKAVRDTIGSE